MIRYDKIKASLFGGVGWRQPTLSGYDIVDSDNQQSDSGLFFQDASSFCTIQNVKDSQQDVDVSDAQFNDYLKSLQESCIVEACNKITANESDLVQSVNLYPYEKAFNETLEKRGRFVGFEFGQPRCLSMIGRIPWIELSFNEDVVFDIHLFNSNRKDPIETKSVTASANESVIFDLGYFIGDNDQFKGGNFYLGYFEDDLGTAKAIKKDYDLSNFQVSTKLFDVNPISLDVNGTQIDVRNPISESDTFGLNIGVDIYNDYTELIIRNKNMFWNAISYQMSEKVLSVLFTSVRSNRTQRNLKLDAGDVLFDLHGDKERGIKGVKSKLFMAIADIKKMIFYKPLISRGTLG